MTEAQYDSIARAFVDARLQGQTVHTYPGAAPVDLDAAYRIQAAARGLVSDMIGGWKVGRIPDAVATTVGDNRFGGPVFQSLIVDAADGAVPEMAIFQDGFSAAEAEFMLRLRAVPESFAAEWTNEAVSEYVDAIRVGIEVASSPFAGINASGPAITVSDFGNNHGLVLGPIVPCDSDIVNWDVAVSINGAQVGAARANVMLDGPMGAVRFLFEQARDRGLPLSAGQWISTGAVTGVHVVRPGDAVSARFGDAWEVRCTVKGDARLAP